MQSERPYLPLAVVVAGALIAAAIYFGASSSPSNYGGNLTGTQAAESIPDATSKDHIIGDPNAKVVLIEYSDLECPFCKVFHATMQQVMDAYKGQSVAWVYRHFPIAELHSRAPKESEASECAAEQGGNTAFWNFINKVYSTTASNNTLDPSALPTIAQSIGLDVTAFNQCLSSGKYADAIKNDVKEAIKAGAQGTPYTIVKSGDKNIVISGAQPFDVVKQTIDTLLK